jgi:hypothetical protein
MQLYVSSTPSNDQPGNEGTIIKNNNKTDNNNNNKDHN